MYIHLPSFSFDNRSAKFLFPSKEKSIFWSASVISPPHYYIPIFREDTVSCGFWSLKVFSSVTKQTTDNHYTDLYIPQGRKNTIGHITLWVNHSIVTYKDADMPLFMYLWICVNHVHLLTQNVYLATILPEMIGNSKSKNSYGNKPPKAFLLALIGVSHKNEQKVKIGFMSTFCRPITARVQLPLILPDFGILFIFAIYTDKGETKIFSVSVFVAIFQFCQSALCINCISNCDTLVP